ncbi:orotidine 5'-phosphate decarboxylase / HUMPS family protein, partial [Planctomycetota bacterium]
EGVKEAGVTPKPFVLAVTVLTSLNEEMVREELRIPYSPQEQVAFWAGLAQESGADGVVCSPKEIETVRKECGSDFLIVTPGIRPAWAVKGDQQRIAAPGEAVKNGADYLVIGRPITQAPDRLEAVRLIAEEIQGSV